MESDEKYDKLMKDIFAGEMEGKWQEIIKEMDVILKTEGLGSFDDMMEDLMEELKEKQKIEKITNEEGVVNVSMEMVFGFFNHKISLYKEKLAQN